MITSMQNKTVKELLKLKQKKMKRFKEIKDLLENVYFINEEAQLVVTFLVIFLNHLKNIHLNIL